MCFAAKWGRELRASDASVELRSGFVKLLADKATDRLLGAHIIGPDAGTLIAELTDHMVATSVQYRHQWKVGDIVIWDNRCALHSATGGYPIEEKRIHWRCTIMQDAAAAQRAA